jgi:hypothetical protein
MQIQSKQTLTKRALWPLVAIGVVLIFAYHLVPVRTVSIAREPGVWFAPLDTYLRPWVGYGGSRDYMVLFGSNEAESILAPVTVFKMYAPFINWASDADLRNAFSELKRHNISLALETGVLTASKECGGGLEGYGGDTDEYLARRILRLDGELSYIAMDEPVWYGHYFSGPKACHATFHEIARNAAQNLAAVKRVFPNVKAGDGEPIGGEADEAVIREYGLWSDAYRTVVGEPLAFFHADVQWKARWREPLEILSAVLQERGIPLGIIYNGDDDDKSDTAWVSHAIDHYRTVAADDRITPKQAVFQSWVAHPTHIFPDSDPGTFAYLLKNVLSTTPR